MIEIIIGIFAFVGVIVWLSVASYFICFHASKGWFKGSHYAQKEIKELNK